MKTSEDTAKGSPTRRELLRLGLSLMAFGLAAGPALAGAAEDLVTKAANEVMTLARSGLGKAAMRSRFNSVLGRYVDARSISLLALGTFRKQLPEAKTGQFLQLSRDYISAFFVYYIDDLKGIGFDVISIAKQGKFTTVNGTIRFAGGDTDPVRWRLLPAGGGFRVQDVNIRGVWLSLALKDRYTDILKRSRGDFEPLFAELRSAESW